MSSLRTLFIALLSTSLAVAQEEGKQKPAAAPTDAVEVLKKADAATKAVKAVSYDVESAANGMGGRTRVEGSVVLSGIVGRMPEKFRIDAKLMGAGSDEARRVIIAADGENYYLLDEKTKTLHKDIDPSVLGRAGQALQALLMIEFVHASPFSDEINGAKQERRGDKKIGDEDCHEIYVEYGAAGQGQTAVWYFSKKDFLPRAVKRGRVGAESAALEMTLSKLVADPKLDQAKFKLEAPEGYTTSDEPAP